MAVETSPRKETQKKQSMPHRPTQLPQKLKTTATNACGRLLRVDDGTGGYPALRIGMR